LPSIAELSNLEAKEKAGKVMERISSGNQHLEVPGHHGS